MAPTRSLKVVISGDSRDFDRALKSADRGLTRFDVAVGNSAHKTRVFADSLGLVKPAAMITGVGLAAQGVATLGAAGVATAASLAPLAGAFAAYPALIGAAAQGMGVFKLATAKVFPVVGGLNKTLDKSTRAFKDLTPEAQKFAVQLDTLKKPLRDLPTLAQKGLLPGLAKGIRDASQNLPVLRKIVTETARSMGGLAESAGHLVGSKGFGSDLATQGERNVRWLGIGGQSALHLADALRHVILASGPLVDWMAKSAFQISKVVDQQAKAGRESGKLASFFDQTRIAMSRVGRIAADVAAAFFNIGKAGKPLGDDILVSLVHVANQFRKWTDSARGQNAIKAFFEQARPGIFELGKLIRDVVKAFGVLSTGSQIAPLISMIRTQLLPVFTQLVGSTTAAFGPALISAVGNIGRLFGSLAGSSGPLVVFVRLIGGAAGALANITSKNPGLQAMVISFAGLAGVIKAVRFVGMITGLTTVLGAVSALKAGYIAETGAQAASTVAAVRWRAAAIASSVAAVATGVATKAWTAAQWLLNAALTANPIGLIIVGLAALGAGLVLAYRKSETFRNVVNGAFNAVKSVADTVIGFVKSHWQVMVASLAGPFGLAILAIIKHFGAIKDKIGDVIGWFRDLPGKVLGAVKGLGGKIVDGIVGGLGQLGHAILQKFKDAAGFVKDKISGLFSGIGSVITGGGGDGIGKALAGGVLPSGGAFGGSLMGARSSLRPFAAIGSGFGLHVSSGRRLGSITSSGNVSYHSSGEAIDEAGSPAGMMGFFRYLKSHFGGRLAELIYGPGRIGIKNGQPFNFGAALNAQHMDHVHVALDTGRPGVGDGVGRIARTGDGIGQIKALWTQAGGSSSAQNMAAAIAMAESSGSPSAKHVNSNGTIDRGLWQINSIWGGLSTFDRLGNARAAVKISGNGRNWNPWSVYKSGAYKRFLGAAGSTGASGGGSSKSKVGQKGSDTVRLRGGLNQPLPSYLDAQGYQEETPEERFTRLRGGPTGPGRGSDARAPQKGLTPDEQAAIAANQAGDGGDPNQALIDATNAAAAIQQSLVDQVAGLRKDVQAQTDFATSVQSTSNYQLTKSLADLISGHIVGRGVAGRSFTPGSGVEYAY
jgi:hypothetical protein